MKFLTKQTLLFSTLFLIVVSFFGSCITGYCSLDDNPTPPPYAGERQAVTVSIVNADATGTRGVSETIECGTPVKFNTGRIFLVNAAGNIERVFEIVANYNAPTTSYTVYQGERILSHANPQIFRGHLDTAPTGGVTGVTIPAVPASIRYVYIVGNYYVNNPLQAGNLLLSSGSIDDVLDRQLYIQSQFNAYAPGVTIFGRRNLVNANRTIELGGDTFNVFETPSPVHLVPRVARFEISSIVGAGDITGFTVSGIFMDGFWRNINMDGINHANFVSSGTNANAFLFAAGTPYYVDILRATHDTFSVAAGSGGNAPRTVRPVPANHDMKWSYHLFANGYYNPRLPVSVTNPRLPANIAPPNIIIRFSSVTVNNGTPINETRFLTINELIYTGSTGHDLYTGDRCANNILQVIRPSRIYRINRIEFAYRDLSTLPNDNPINVEVEVSVDGWDNYTFRPEQPLRQSQLQGRKECPGAIINVNLPAAIGGTWNFTYSWYTSSTGSDPWAPIPNANGVNLQNFELTQETWIRRRVADGGVVNGVPTPPIYTQALFSIHTRRDFPDYVEINGVVWSTRNVGAPGTFVDHPSDPGMLFQWNRRVGWSSSGTLVSSDGSAWNPNPAPGTVWETANDPCPDGWRVPTIAEIHSLLLASPGTANPPTGLTRGRGLDATASGIAGYGCQVGRIFGYDTNDNDKIFLPAVAVRMATSGAFYNPSWAFYWSSTGMTGQFAGTHAYDLFFEVTDSDIELQPHRAHAKSVRCVRAAPVPQISQPNYTRPNPRPICPNECVIDDLGAAYWVDCGTPLTFGTEVTYLWERLNTTTNQWQPALGAVNTGLTFNINTWELPAYFRRVATSVEYGSFHISNVLRVEEIQRVTPYPAFTQRPLGTTGVLAGLYWATHNIDLSRTAHGRVTEHPADGGMFFQFSRERGYESTGQFPTQHWNAPPTDTWTNWAGAGITWNTSAETVTGTAWNPAVDPCRHMGAGWRLPTRAEYLALIAVNNNYWSSAINTAVELGLGCMPGRVFRNPANPDDETNWVFFPASGFRYPGVNPQGVPLPGTEGRLGGIYGRFRVCHYASNNEGGDPTNFFARMRTSAAENPTMANAHRATAVAVRCVYAPSAFSQPFLVDATMCPSFIVPRPHPHVHAQNIYVWLNLGVATYNGVNITNGVTYQWRARPTSVGTWVDINTPVAQQIAQATQWREGQNILITSELFGTNVSFYIKRRATWTDGGGTTHVHYTRFARVTEPQREPASFFSDSYIQVTVQGRQTRWATRNVDLSTVDRTDIPANLRGFAYHPADPGMMFQWNRPYGWYGTRHISDTDASVWWETVFRFRPTRRWNPAYGAPLNRWQSATWDNFGADNVMSWGVNNRGPCPEGFRLPTLQEMNDLISLINTQTWRSPCTPVGCALGHAVVQNLFFPAASVRGNDWGEMHPEWVVEGFYWSDNPGRGTGASAPNAAAVKMHFTTSSGSTFDFGRQWGVNVRCVRIPAGEPGALSGNSGNSGGLSSVPFR